MVDFTSAETEAEFIESIRDIFRAYVPESDAWAQPNFFSVNATVVGGLSWSSIMEARRGFDIRANLQTAEGEYLDLLAATPPLNLTRRAATVATGDAAVSDWPTASIPAGTIFETAAGVKFSVDTTTPFTGNYAVVPLTSLLTGSANNSLNGQPLESAANNATAVSFGIFGGYDIETDEQFRARIYGEQTRYTFFGSPCSYERLLPTVPGVSRAWAVEDGGVVSIAFLMEDRYPCGQPTAEDIEFVQQSLDDPCLTPLFFCPVFIGACSRSIDLVIEWATAPDDICAIEREMELWLRDNYSLGEGVRGCDIDAWLRDNYGELGPVIDCCEDFPPQPCCVYNCVNLTPSCEGGDEPGSFELNDYVTDGPILLGDTLTGDLRLVNPGLPPGGVFATDFENTPGMTVLVQSNGEFIVSHNMSVPCPEVGNPPWSFNFTYTLGDVVAAATASGQLECDEGGGCPVFSSAEPRLVLVRASAKVDDVVDDLTTGILLDGAPITQAMVLAGDVIISFVSAKDEFGANAIFSPVGVRGDQADAIRNPVELPNPIIFVMRFATPGCPNDFLQTIRYDIEVIVEGT